MSCIINCIETTSNSTNWTEIATVITAFSAILLATFEGFQIRKHNRLSVKPKLSTFQQINSGALESAVTLDNNGVGPAVINQFTVLLDDQKMVGDSAYELIGVALSKIFRLPSENFKFLETGSLAKSYFMPANSKTTIFSVKIDPSSNIKEEEFLQGLRRLNLIVEYSDIYNAQQPPLQTKQERENHQS